MVARSTKTAAAEPIEEVDNNSDVATPRRIKKGSRKAPRVTLFEYEDEDGNVTEFTVPEKPGPNVTLKFLNELRKSGNEMFASMSLLESMLGKEKYEELLDIEDLEDDDLANILEAVVKLAMERAEEVSGK
jgi:hypothetical protein